MPYVYKITNDINDKVYVGKTEFSLSRRFGEHCRDARKRRCEKRPLYSAIRKYGAEHFSIELIEETDRPEEREMYWIDKLGTYEHGYNATKGGDSKKYLDHEKIIETYEIVKNLAEVSRILHVDPGYVSDILVANGRTPVSCGEVAQKYNGKPVEMYSKSGEHIKTFPSLIAAAQYVLPPAKVSSHERGAAWHISDACKGKRKSAYGYVWKFGNATFIPIPVELTATI